MVYRGRVENGVIVLEGGACLPEGAEVTIQETPKARSRLGAKLLRFAGTVDDLPSDGSRNLDHYLYGAPRAVMF